MDTRRIQFVAGTTYSVSLPKDWVRKNHLKQKSTVTFHESTGNNLIVTPGPAPEKKSNEISLNIDSYIKNIDQVLFSLYYLGFEEIHLFSKKEISKDSGMKVRKTLHYMSGTEISYEDEHNIKIKVLLDKSKIDIIQVLYRTMLIVQSSSECLEGKGSIEEIRMNENEINRLYHLISKIISLSLTDSSILTSSKIMHPYLIPSYFLIAKKLENIADNLEDIAEQLHKNNVIFEPKEILTFIREEMARCAKEIIGKKVPLFEKAGNEKQKEMISKIARAKDKLIQNYLEDILRYIIDIEEELVIIGFHAHLIGEKLIN
jgi:phosphate uptake regulator